MQGMDELAERWPVSAWKRYTQWGPEGRGFFLHDEDTGLRMIEKARALGVRNVCVHKGLPLGPQLVELQRSRATSAIIAKIFPEAKFMVYHSGFIGGTRKTL